MASPDWPNHDHAWRQWRGAMSGSRMHHAWIIAGKKGIGKRDLAIAAARELVAENAGAQPAGDHPDIIVLTYGPKDKKAETAAANGKSYELARSIRVGQIRAMQRRLTTRPTLGERRVVIVDPADDMETNAANALLKSLEEPPAGTFFILIGHRPARLLPTIRSRCRMLRVPTLTNEQIDAKLIADDAGQGEDARKAAIHAAQGSYGAAVRFAQQDLAPISGLIRNLIARGDRDLSLRGQLGKMIGPRPDRERMSAVLELAQSIVAESACSAQSSAQRAALSEIHVQLVKLARDAPVYNFDPGLLSLDIGTLLTRATPSSEHGHV